MIADTTRAPTPAMDIVPEVAQEPQQVFSSVDKYNMPYLSFIGMAEPPPAAEGKHPS